MQVVMTFVIAKSSGEGDGVSAFHYGMLIPNLHQINKWNYNIEIPS